MTTVLDHIVVAAATLDEGEAWTATRLQTGLGGGGSWCLWSHNGYYEKYRLCAVLGVGGRASGEGTADERCRCGQERGCLYKST